MSSFWSAAAVVCVGLALVLSTVALVVARTRSSTRRVDPTWERRLTDCESLQRELLQEVSSLVTRDRLRAVRAAKSTTEKIENRNEQPDSAPAPTRELSTAELRRQLHMQRFKR